MYAARKCKATANTCSLLNSDKTFWRLRRGHNIPGGANQLPELYLSSYLVPAVITQQTKSSLEIPDKNNCQKAILMVKLSSPT